MSSFSIMIVEDDPWYGKILQHHLSLNPDYKVSRFLTGKECLANLHEKPDLVTIDFSLPDMEGDVLFKKIKEYSPDLPVIVISSQENISVAVNMLKMGASDYLVKDDATKDLLWNSVIRIKENQGLKKEVAELREELGQKFSFDKSIIGQSEPLKKVFALMEKALKTIINVSITGETGTGKEVVAKAIHYNSDRKKKKFIAVNMAAIPKELIESELFGYEKGAFTGALTRKTGKFEEANGGTIFLDEIAELDLNLQSKLLRVLQEREIERVGGNEIIKLDVRLLVATHKNLQEEVDNGNFREDLYYRIVGLPIALPPLRERGSDILVLAKYFTDLFAKENKMSALSLTHDAKEKLMKYHFPGNVRELKSMIDLSAVMCDGKEIKAEDINYTSTKANKAFMLEEKTLNEYNIDIIKFFLKKYDDIGLVADKLAIGKSTLYKMIKRGELD
jgi:two-component system, NtrC family, response regulator AtoC